jgi:hypothetical protein
MYQSTAPDGQDTSVWENSRNSRFGMVSNFSRCSERPRFPIFRFLAINRSMLARILNAEVILVVLLAIVAVVFFPAARGSYVSTHGPVTAARSLYESTKLRLSVALAVFRRNLTVALSIIQCPERMVYSRVTGGPGDSFPILRI